MSKLIDLLQRVGEGTAGPMGFGALGRKASTSEVILIGRLSEADLAKDGSPFESAADAILLVPTEERPLAEKAKLLSNQVWGVRQEALTAGQASDLAEQGCDFVVFESTDTEAGVLVQEGLATLTTLSAEVDERVIRSTAQLPVDGVLFSPSLRSFPLTLKTLVEVQLVRGLVGKPFLVEAPEGIEPADLQVLRDIGVVGVIVDVESGRVARVKEAISALPRRRERLTGRDALIPAAAATVPTAPEPEPEEDDYDDDF